MRVRPQTDAQAEPYYHLQTTTCTRLHADQAYLQRAIQAQWLARAGHLQSTSKKASQASLFKRCSESYRHAASTQSEAACCVARPASRGTSLELGVPARVAITCGSEAHCEGTVHSMRAVTGRDVQGMQT